jgi:hypothetical protein
LAERSLAACGPSARWEPDVLRRAAGSIGHMRPNPDAFAVPSTCRTTVAGARMLLLDDVYVSGSRAQSAATTLRRAGASSVLIVPLGRVIRPTMIAAHAAFLMDQPAANGHGARCLVAQTGAGRP